MSTFMFNRAKREMLATLTNSISLARSSSNVKVMLLEGNRTCDVTDLSTDITNLPSSAGMVGLTVEFSGFPVGTVVSSILGGTSVRCSSACSGTFIGATVLFKPNPDQVFISDFSALELAAAGYAGGFGGAGRKSLANIVTAADNVNNQAYFDADDMTWATLGGVDIVTGACLVVENQTNDDSIAIAHIDSMFPLTLSGIDVLIQWNANGIIRG